MLPPPISNDEQLLQCINEQINHLASVSDATKKEWPSIPKPSIDNFKVGIAHQLMKLEYARDQLAIYLSQMLMGKDLPDNFQWIQALQAPITISNELQSHYAQKLRMFQSMHPHMTLAESAFLCYQLDAVYDPQYSYYVASQLLPSGKMIDAEISNQLLKMHRGDANYTYQQFENDLFYWPKKQLTHVFLLAAKFMPSAKSWRNNSPGILQGLINTVNHPDFTFKQLQGVFTTLTQRCNGVGINSTLDHLRFLFTGDHEEIQQLKKMTMGELLKSPLSTLQKYIPVFMLCPTAVGYKNHTIGVQSFKLQFQCQGAYNLILDVQPVTMQVVQYNSEKKYKTLTSAYYALHAGECLLSPYMGAFLHNDFNSVSCDPHHNLNRLTNIQSTPADLQQRFVDLKCEFTSACYNRHQPNPGTVVAWKIETPKRILKNVHYPPQHCFSEPSRITRFITHKNSTINKIGGLMIIDKPDDCVRNYVKDALLKSFENAFHPVYNKLCQEHPVIAEAVACWAFHEPMLHTIVAVKHSTPWQQSECDHRYAETQIGENTSARYRDWCEFMQAPVENRLKTHGPLHSYRCKLDSHVFQNNNLYQTWFPCFINTKTNATALSRYEWINVTSNKPLATQFIKCNNELKNWDQFQSTIDEFVRTNKSTFDTSRYDIHTYKDETQQKILVSLASKTTQENNIHFVVFTRNCLI